MGQGYLVSQGAQDSENKQLSLRKIGYAELSNGVQLSKELSEIYEKSIKDVIVNESSITIIIKKKPPTKDLSLFQDLCHKITIKRKINSIKIKFTRQSGKKGTITIKGPKALDSFAKILMELKNPGSVSEIQQGKNVIRRVMFGLICLGALKNGFDAGFEGLTNLSPEGFFQLLFVGLILYLILPDDQHSLYDSQGIANSIIDSIEFAKEDQSEQSRINTTEVVLKVYSVDNVEDEEDESDGEL